MTSRAKQTWLVCAVLIALMACEPDRADVFMKVEDDGVVALVCERSGTLPKVSSELVKQRIDNFATSVCRGEAQIDDRRVMYDMPNSGPQQLELRTQFTCLDARRADVASERFALCDRLFEESDDPLVGLR